MPERDGLVLLDKTSGITSHDAVMRFRRASGVRKTGHTGTLDPLATGLLVLCVGRATRLQSFLTGMPKTYVGEIQFGWATDTYDAEGTPVGEPVGRNVTVGELESVIRERFLGEIEQMPPAYSARKVEGRRAYAIARQGEVPQLEARHVTVEEFRVLAVDGSVASFRVRSSAGTYVRSLAHDLGQAIGSAAHLKSLRRTAIGAFRLDDAVSADTLGELSRDEIFASPHFIPMSRVELPIERVLIDPAQEHRLMSGQSVIVPAGEAVLRTSDLVAVTNLANELVAIGEAVDVLREDGGPVRIQPRVVLKEQGGRAGSG